MPKGESRSSGLPPYQSMLERYPEHVKAIGMIAVEMTNVEVLLADLLGAMLNLRRPIAEAIYFSPQSTGPRLSIVKNAAKSALTPDMAKIVIDLTEEARSCQNTRNDLLHDSWGIDAATSKITRRKLPLHQHKGKVADIKALERLVMDLRHLATDIHLTIPRLHSLIWQRPLSSRFWQRSHPANRPPNWRLASKARPIRRDQQKPFRR